MSSVVIWYFHHWYLIHWQKSKNIATACHNQQVQQLIDKKYNSYFSNILMDAIEHSDWSFVYLPRHLIGSLTSTTKMIPIRPVTNNEAHQAAGARPKIKWLKRELGCPWTIMDFHVGKITKDGDQLLELVFFNLCHFWWKNRVPKLETILKMVHSKNLWFIPSWNDWPWNLDFIPVWQTFVFRIKWVSMGWPIKLCKKSLIERMIWGNTVFR